MSSNINALDAWLNIIELFKDKYSMCKLNSSKFYFDWALKFIAHKFKLCYRKQKYELSCIYQNAFMFKVWLNRVHIMRYSLLIWENHFTPSFTTFSWFFMPWWLVQTFKVFCTFVHPCFWMVSSFLLIFFAKIILYYTHQKML